MKPAILLCCAVCALGQSFDVASLKPNPRPAGRDDRGHFLFEPKRVSARNVSLKDLILEAYGAEPFQLSGGPRWLDTEEFDLDARTEAPATKEQMRSALQNLLAERFRLTLRKESKQLKGYELVVDKNGPKIHADAAATGWFHGDMRQLANLISVQLTIPPIADPTRPAFAIGTPVPVIDKTGLEGTYGFTPDGKPESGADPFVTWQRTLQEQLGLRLESRRVNAVLLVVQSVDRLREL